MNTFLPFASYVLSARVLDDRRLHNQINEAGIILDRLAGPGPWQNHPVVLMWVGCDDSLIRYRNTCIVEAQRRGLATSAEIQPREHGLDPAWLGWGPLHKEYQASLYQKDPEHYQAFQGSGEFIGYHYPTPDCKPYQDAARAAIRCKTARGRERNAQKAVDLFNELCPDRVRYHAHCRLEIAGGFWVRLAQGAYVASDGTAKTRDTEVCLTKVHVLGESWHLRTKDPRWLTFRSRA